MPDVLIRGVPERITRFLRDEARAHGRSIQGELLALIESTVDERIRRRAAIDDARRIRKELEAEGVTAATTSNSAELVRADRDR